jgi:hypothetical protein
MPELKWDMVIFGGVGGLLPDILRLIQNRYAVSTPAYLKSPIFWVSVILLVLLGGFSAWLLGAGDVKQALAYGFGAPEIISRVLGKIAGGVDRGVDRGAEGKTVDLKLTDWWGA